MNTELYSFYHDAMDAPYELAIHGCPEDYARQASDAVFLEIDYLEEKLSKFVEYSDVGRIAVLKPGESVFVTPETMECLLSAVWVHRETAGAFDISKGQGLENLVLDPDNLTATVNAPLTLDLGGIGKGYALDVAAEILSEWDVKNFFVAAGPSTVLCVGSGEDEEWRIGVNGEPVCLRDQALSASGKDVQGEHVMDPRTGKNASGHEKAWAICPSGAVADALSTAFMVMSSEEVEALCLAHDGVNACLLSENGDFLSF
jgi:thiamine biosynthesis lipoprotein